MRFVLQNEKPLHLRAKTLPDRFCASQASFSSTPTPMTSSLSRLSNTILLLALVSAFMVAGCSLVSEDGKEAEEEAILGLVEDQREKWEGEGYENYQYTYRIARSGEVFRRISVTVEKGEVADASVVGDEDMNVENPKTVTDFFDEVEAAVRRDTRQFEVDFDAQLGYLRNLNVIYTTGNRFIVTVPANGVSQTGDDGEQATLAASTMDE